MGIKCTKCGAENPETATFCSDCGTQLHSSEKAEFTETLEKPREELTTGVTFAKRYQIIEELGKGGMGRVYKAVDTKIKEKVALKLIKPEIASDKKTLERFGNELRIARKIVHKNVGRMYDINEHQGTHYISMEYVSGQDLKDFIRQSGRMGVGTAILIIKQVCEGLSEAHKLGVVHRDLKPGNIMIDREGKVRIMDFGIARSLKEKGLTDAGVMIGTPEYMSPEQVEGKEVDPRSDIYSLGIILYEMITGRVPFEGDTPFSIGIKHKSETPKDPRELNSQIPEDLSHIILKCLEKDKEKRYQSAQELHSELEKIEKGIPTSEKIIPKKKPLTSRELTVTFGMKKVLLPVLVVLLVITAGLIIWSPWKKPESVSSPSKKASIAVLPFVDMSVEKDQGYLCDGLADELINRLAKINGIRVPARTSSFSFRGKEVDIQEIGTKLHVNTILEGSLQKANNQLRIRVRLINVSDSQPLWSEAYVRDEKDIFALQDEISLSIVNNLRISLLGEEKSELVKHYTENIEVYNLYLRGRYFWNKRTREDLEKAIQYFEKAVELDPGYAMAYVGLAETYSVLPWYSNLNPEACLQKANNAAQKALEIDNTLGEAHAALASVKLDYLNLEEAEKSYKRALELNSGYATAHHWYGVYLMDLGRFEDAINEFKRALELDPLSLVINRNYGELLCYSRQYDKAIKQLKKTLEMDPNFSEIHIWLGVSYLKKSMYEEALEEFQKEIALKKDFNPQAVTYIGITYSLMDQIDRTQEICDDLLEKSKKEYIPQYFIALLYFTLGENDQGFEWLEKAHKKNDIRLKSLKADPLMDGFRSDPRYTALLEKIGLRGQNSLKP